MRELNAGSLAKGTNSVRWNGRDNGGAEVVSGTYFYRLTVDGNVAGDAKRMTLVK